jgi:hypothetical protein
MKKILFACMVILVGISFCWAAEGYDNLARLVKSKVSEDVIIAYINSSIINYNLTPDDIINLKEMGASGKVITAAIQHKVPVKAASTASAASAPEPVYGAPGNTDDAAVYESAPLPPPVDYWYNGYWQYPTDDFIYAYPGWQPYYGYHQNYSNHQNYGYHQNYSNHQNHRNDNGYSRGNNNGSSSRHGNVDQRSRTGSLPKSEAANKKPK